MLHVPLRKESNMRSLRGIGEEIRRQTRRVEVKKPMMEYFGVCTNLRCSTPHPPVIRTDLDLKDKSRELCGCGQPLIFLLKQGTEVVAIANPRGSHFTFICTKPDTKCGPKFRAQNSPPTCAHKVPMKLATFVRRRTK
jgi:hypothetical protein